MRHITSPQNPLIKQLKKLSQNPKFRKKESKIILDGVHLCEEYRKKVNPNIEIFVSETFIQKPEWSKFKSVQTITLLPEKLFFSEKKEKNTCFG